MALRNFTEIQTGTQFPPERERTRVNVMDTWLERYSRRFANPEYRLKGNSYKYIAHFWQDVVISVPPEFSYAGDGRQQEALDLIAPSVVQATRQIVIDLVRYGSGVYANAIPFNVTSLDPRFYYPVELPETGQDLGAITTMPYTVDPTNTMADRLAITEYRAGDTVTTTSYHKLDGLSVGPIIQDDIERPGMQPILVTYGAGEFGTSWYEDIDDYVTDLHRRESGVSKSLDRHNNPHLAVPEGVIEVDAQGRAQIAQDGMIIPVPDGADVAPQFITWDPKFGSQENAMTRAIERIERYTAVAPVLTQAREMAYNLPSGSALRRLSIVTVQRCQSLREILGPAMRQAIADNAEVIRLSGIDAPVLDPDSISIEWPLPLSTPGDETEWDGALGAAQTAEA